MSSPSPPPPYTPRNTSSAPRYPADLSVVQGQRSEGSRYPVDLNVVQGQRSEGSRPTLEGAQLTVERRHTYTLFRSTGRTPPLNTPSRSTDRTRLNTLSRETTSRPLLIAPSRSTERTPLMRREYPKNENHKIALCIVVTTFVAFGLIASMFFAINNVTSHQPSCNGTFAECHHRKQVEEERGRQRIRQGRQKARLEAGMHWETPTGAKQCALYSTRVYTAQLLNIPLFESWEESCNMTSIVIHNVTLESPDRCKKQGWFGGMHGYWLVNFGEPACVPVWGSFKDEGCTTQGSGKRRFSSRLWNVHGDWAVMCSSTPADIHGIHFANPTSCEDKGLLGLYGIWDIDDLGCQEKS